MEVPASFKFPYQPYSIQLEFMKSIYKCIEEKKLGIFESPTGTGKSLSIICGSLTWLLDHEKKEKLELEKELEVLLKSEDDTEQGKKKNINLPEPAPLSIGGEPNWFLMGKAKLTRNHKISTVKEKLNLINCREERIRALVERAKIKISKSAGSKCTKHTQSFNNSSTPVEDDVLLDEDWDAVLEEKEFLNGQGDFYHVKHPQIIFASRTHSQISQFVREVKKSPFGSTIRLCTLASRQQLCINAEVNRLKSSSLINDKCLELQKKCKVTLRIGEDNPIKKSKNSTCPFLNADSIQHVTDNSLTNVVDIENLMISGRKENGCPYYAARNALKDAQIVVVPYSTLLQKTTREACGLSLINNIVIIDEAHNLLETISSINSKTISAQQLRTALLQITQYQQKYQNRLSAKSVLPIKQLLFFISQLSKFAGESSNKNLEEGKHTRTANFTDDGNNVHEEVIYDCSQFCMETGVDHLNIRTLLDFCEKSKFQHKLMNFKPEISVSSANALTEFVGKKKLNKNEVDTRVSEESQNVLHEKDSNGSPLANILDFMRCLLNENDDGRILCVKKIHPSESFFKYVLLNPGSLFKEFVTEPRTVILAGGTMQPMSEFKLHLFGIAGADLNRITTFSCGHIIPPHHVLPLVLTNGPSGKLLDFSWSNRSSLLEEIACLLINVIKVVPGGVVCFLPSYDFERQFYGHLLDNGHLSKLQTHKKVFREPKEANHIDRVLRDYAASITNCGGSKCSGGKLSEGINFSDDLARCVIVIGLPYPNSQSVELQAKMDYLNKHAVSLEENSGKKLPSQLHYESLCFKAVNQSIGRAIRHINDYAVLMLADHRYSRPTSKSLLPNWIAQQLVVCSKFGACMSATSKFLQGHKNKK